MNKKKALFLDRYGVINIDKGFVYTSVKFVFIEGILELIKKAKEKKYLIIIITNQSGIGRGYFKEQDFHYLMTWINIKLEGLIDDYYFCPYHEKFGVGKYKIKSNDRKPNPGMIFKAIRKHNIDSEVSIFVGDKVSDMIAAERANVKFRLLFGDFDKKNYPKYKIIKNLNEVLNYLI